MAKAKFNSLAMNSKLYVETALPQEGLTAWSTPLEEDPLHGSNRARAEILTTLTASAAQTSAQRAAVRAQVNVAPIAPLLTNATSPAMESPDNLMR